jgi:5-methylcytosine-specific restriction endonuclease McrBC regulatory subunit McrC
LKDKTTGAALAIIDAKYKSDDQPNEADIYQVVTYAVQMNAPIAILVYSSFTTKPMQAKIRESVRVLTMTFDISQENLGGRAFLKQITKALKLQKQAV